LYFLLFMCWTCAVTFNSTSPHCCWLQQCYSHPYHDHFKMLLSSFKMLHSGEKKILLFYDTCYILQILIYIASMAGEWIVRMGYFWNDSDRQKKKVVPGGEAWPYNDLSTTYPLSLASDSTKASLVKGWLLTAQIDISKGKRSN